MKFVNYQIRYKKSNQFLYGTHYSWNSKKHLPIWRHDGSKWKRFESVSKKYIRLVIDNPDLEDNIEIVKNDIMVVQSIEPINSLDFQWKKIILTESFNKNVAEIVTNELDGDLRDQKYLMIFRKLSIQKLDEIEKTLINAGLSKNEFVVMKCSPFHTKIVAFKKKEDLTLITLQQVSTQSITVYDIDDLKKLPIKEFRKKYLNV